MITLVLKNITGRLAFEVPRNENEKIAIKHLLNKCEDKYNGYVSVTLAVPYKKRTSGRKSQNSAIHGFAQCIANETGEEMERIKDYCKKRAIRRGYPVKKDENGDVIISRLDGEPIPESSGKVNTVEASYLIDELIQLASELEIVLPIKEV